MSRCRAFHAVPASSALLPLARADAEVAEQVMYFPALLRRSALRLQAPSAGEVKALPHVRAFLADDPTIARRTFDVDTRWDVLHYLLSETRRGSPPGLEPQEVDRLRDLALTGDEPLSEEYYVGGDGVRYRHAYGVRYTEPGQVLLAALALESASIEEMRLYFDREPMRRAHVYTNTGVSEREWAILCAMLAGLQAFYRAAAEHGEGVLVATT